LRKVVAPIEGWYLETVEKLIFTVKGHLHPYGHLVAYVRYAPHPEGDRERGGVRYKRLYHLDEQENFLLEHYPHYLLYDGVMDELLQAVPIKRIVKLYDPTEKLIELQRSRGLLTPVEQDALSFAELLASRAKVPLESLGVSGSILVGLHKPSSDIDLVVYGVNSSRLVHSALLSMLNEDDEVKKLDVEGFRRLYEFRVKDTRIPFETFISQESRKVIQGRFRGREYFIRFVKLRHELTELYGDSFIKCLGRATIRARVASDENAIFTPCVYQILNVEFLEGVKVPKLTQVCSFRGRFCEQAKVGEEVIASGKVEEVQRKDGEVYHRLVVGATPNDYLISLTPTASI